MGELFGKYCLIALILAASILSVADFQQSGRITRKTDAPPNLQDEKAIEQLKQTGGYDSLSKAFEASRYKIERDLDDTLTAENPANQMQARFSESGSLQLSGASQNWQTAWQLKSFGRGGNQMAVGSGSWQSNENRTENRRTEIGLTEYFENRPEGLEQGFILDEKPAGEENLRLVLQTSGELQASASADGQTVILSDAGGAEVLRYDKLKVWDAENKDLTARMTTNKTGEIRLEVEDANAKYPLTIDPTFLQRQKLTAPDGANNDIFGGSVAISGNTAVVGAEYHNSQRGAAYVFVRSGTTWTQQAKLVAADAANNDQFGYSVAISGDTIVVGALYDDIGSNQSQGSAYVFVRNGTNWSAQEKLVAADGEASDLFGGSVGISGETVVIGAFFDKIGPNIDQGSAYVYVRSGGAWTLQQKLFAADGGSIDEFGRSVAIQGGTVIIGAPNKKIGNSYNGAAYVFTRSGTIWSQQSKLTANDGAHGDKFGSSVALSLTLSGAIAVVGAQLDDIAGNESQGSAYVFDRPQYGTWSQMQKLTKSGGAADDNFGRSVAIDSTSGSRIYVSAAGFYSGSVLIFQRVNSVWTEKQRIIPNTASGAYFGYSIAVSGGTMIVGAMFDSSSTPRSGAAYIFNLGSRPFDFDGDGKTDISRFRPSSGNWSYIRSSDETTQTATLGNSTDRITPADFTGDGKTDIAVFRPSNGNWYVLRSEDNTTYSFQFGQSGDIPMPADYDGDYKSDAAVFRPASATWYVLRSSDGGTTTTVFGANGDVPVAADYDGDGKADIAIFRSSSAEWWYLKSSDGQTVNFQFGLSTDKPVPGDYTGDGKADIAVWRGSTGEWFILRSEDSTFYSVQFGASGDLPTPGDYDGDGRFDTAVFRPSEGTWYLNRSIAGTLTKQFGLSTDKPVPNAFVP